MTYNLTSRNYITKYKLEHNVSEEGNYNDKCGS